MGDIQGLGFLVWVPDMAGLAEPSAAECVVVEQARYCVVVDEGHCATVSQNRTLARLRTGVS